MAQVPFQLLELTIISAQNLAPVSRKLRTYAVAWVNPDRKLRTRADQQGNVNPNWNDKFVFRVDDNFLNSDSSALMIEIYSLGWLRDFPVGSVRVLITDLIPPAIQKETNNKRFVALQIRRPSGRPQGILNMCVTLLDNTMHSMPLYTEFSSSAIGFYKDLLEEKSSGKSNNINNNNSKPNSNENGVKKIRNEKPKAKDNIQLRRSRSDRTDLNSHGFQKRGNQSSVCNGSIANRSMGNGSLINGGSMVNGSMVNGSEIGINSDVGPSPSVVAAAVAMGLYPTQIPVPRKAGTSILEDWTVEESSVEGLKSKIDRWKMEVPPIYDRRDYQRLKKNHRHPRNRQYTDGGGGLFSCFGTAYGCECNIVCGGNESKKTGRRYGSASEVNLLPSEVNS